MAITLQNNSKATLIHNDVRLYPDEIKDIPDKVAKIFMLNKGIIEYKDPQEAKAEKEALEAENAKLKAEIEKLKANKEAKAEKEADKTKDDNKTNK